jgi:hypothetical protein
MVSVLRPGGRQTSRSIALNRKAILTRMVSVAVFFIFNELNSFFRLTSFIKLFAFGLLLAAELFKAS